MSYIIFENPLGSLTFCGDGSSPLSLREVHGLGTPERIYQTRQYWGQDGQVTLSSHFDARTISIAFDLFAKDLREQTAKIHRIFSLGGTLYICGENKNRRIEANRVTVSEFTRHGSAFRSFAVQFVCDDPFFKDPSPTYLPCRKMTSNIVFVDGKWNLDTPIVWGVASPNVSFSNLGHFNAYPTFTLYSAKDALSGDGFEILRVDPKNSQTVIQRFALNYLMSNEERITLSFSNRNEKGRRYIKSSTGENLLPYKSEESRLSDFWLSPGDNRIIVRNLSEGNDLSAYISYENQYIEGAF